MDIQKILSQMTLEEKCALLQGKDDWHTVPLERLGVPSAMVSDGPHGLRKQVPGQKDPARAETVPAVCFPTAAGTASSFDRSMMEMLGETLGEECVAENVNVLLGPAANIKRSPLCGRNFEYFSEDPLLSGEIAGGWIRGIQSKGVGCSLKHFAANNQETLRMSISETISQRALREIYLASFEHAVKSGKPWTMMCSYNKINGVYSSENQWLLTDVLRKEWGFDGIVMTDWGACNDHVKGVASGLELEMPRAGDDDDALLADAVRNGKVPMEVIDRAAARMLQLVERTAIPDEKPEMELGVHHHVARKIARESMVLLKNDGALLPIRGNKKVAFIGAFAEKPRYQGGGSSHITVNEEITALQAVRSVSPVTYAKGFEIDSNEIDETLQQEAVRAAEEADIAVLFVGLPETWESEGYDRTTLNIPGNQAALIEAVTAVQSNVVVVLHNGSPVVMPWINKVPAVLEAYLGGQAGGAAVVDLLFGAVSPCGKLAETFPLRLEDTPAYLNFPGDGKHVNYAEDIYVGYRYYDKRKLPVLFPFGHGLSYTTFEYSDLQVTGDLAAYGAVQVSVNVTNTGHMQAKEAVQFYVRPETSGKDRPVRELRGFDKVELKPSETKKVSIALTLRDFSYWEEEINDWLAEPGRYFVEAAASSRDIRLETPVELPGVLLPFEITGDTPYGVAKKIPGSEATLQAFLPAGAVAGLDGESMGEAGKAMMEAMISEMPLHSLCSFTPVTRQQVQDTVKQLNELLKKSKQ